MTPESRQRLQEVSHDDQQRLRPWARELAPTHGGHTAAQPEPTFRDYLVTLAEGRWLIALSVLVAIVAGTAYIALAPPTYRSDIVAQVEDKSPGAGGTLDQLSLMMGGKTPAETEIEIIRSRYLVGAVVDQLALDVLARPRTFPLVGAAAYRRHAGEALASPWPGLSRFAWGGERLTVGRIEVQ